ncbi:hypothetical protein H6764_01670 [Candidatus Nomurabacteria bacterium]|nr:hypothetical protein [Candidatus Nomurabacteria bacterium]
MFGFSKSSITAKDQMVYYHEDFSAKDLDETLVGRKGLSLFDLRDMDVPVPDFFVVSPKVYKEFLLNAFDSKLASLLEKVRNPASEEIERLILKGKFSEDFIQDFMRAYSRLSGFSKAWVSVRSSVVYPSKPKVSFSGIFSTELSLRGPEHVLDSIKHVYASVFKEQVLVYANQHEIDLTELEMGVVVQRMVQPEVSGIAYTLDPITSDDKKMSIEAVFGLGDVIADGTLTPDQYFLEKKRLDVVEKHISPQEWMKIRKAGVRVPGTKEEFEKIKISSAWSHQQKLEDKNIKTVAKIALIAEDRSSRPQSIEWVWESGNVWILQNKPLTPKADLEEMNKNSAEQDSSVVDVAIDIVKEEKLKNKKLRDSVPQPKSSGKNSDDDQIEVLDRLGEKIRVLTERANKIDQSKKDKLAKKQAASLRKLGKKTLQQTPVTSTSSSKRKFEFLLSGIGSSFGEVTGEVLVIGDSVPKDLVVTKDTVLVIGKFISKMKPYVLQAGGILMDEGGLTSDISILCREANIPAVVGTGLSSALLQDGDWVRIDGNIGSIYRSKVSSETKVAADKSEKPEPQNQESTKTASKKDNKNSPQIDEDDIPRIPTATKVLINIGEDVSEKYERIVSSMDGIAWVDMDLLMLHEEKHLMAYVKDGTFKSYSKKLEEILDKVSDWAGSNEAIVSMGSMSVAHFRNLVKGTSGELKEAADDLSGAPRLLSNRKLFSRYLGIFKKVRNVYRSRNLSLALHAPLNGDIMKELKKEISASGLRRTSTFNIFPVIENTSELLLLSEIISAGVDGVILNTPLIARQIQGLGVYDQSALYDIEAGSVWKVLEKAIELAKAENIKVIVVCESSTTLVKKCVEWGVYGVAVSPKSAKEIKSVVSEQETKIILRN